MSYKLVHVCNGCSAIARVRLVHEDGQQSYLGTLNTHELTCMASFGACASCGLRDGKPMNAFKVPTAKDSDLVQVML